MGNLNDPVVNGGGPRPFNEDFTLSETETVWVSYTVELSVVAPLLSNQSVTVDLLVSAPSGTPVALDSATLSSSQGGGLSLLSLGTTITRNLTTFVPPNFTVQLAVSGTGDAVLVNTQEAIF